jgi:magnesium-transporting ATPase (P-type)
MNIVVDNDLKKKVQVENRKHRRGIHSLWIFEKVSLAVVIVFIVMFPIYCIATGSFVSTNMRNGEKSYFLVALLTSIIAGMSLTFVLLVAVARMRIENILIGGRVDETIEILEDKLFYTFRIKYQTPLNQRNLVILDLNKIINISYDEILSEISVEGMMAEKIVDASHNVCEIRESEMTVRRLKIWDYFTPSVYEFLKKENHL